MISASTAVKVNNLLSLGFSPAGTASVSSYEKLTTFIDEHPEGIVMLSSKLDAEGNLQDFVYTFINRTAEVMLQRPKTKMIGKLLLDEFPGTVSDGIFDIYKKVYSTGKSTVLQFHYTHEGFDTSFRQKIEKFENGILIHTADLSRSKSSGQFPHDF